jgi:hypothetical protein
VEKHQNSTRVKKVAPLTGYLITMKYFSLLRLWSHSLHSVGLAVLVNLNMCRRLADVENYLQ